MEGQASVEGRGPTDRTATDVGRAKTITSAAASTAPAHGEGGPNPEAGSGHRPENTATGVADNPPSSSRRKTKKAANAERRDRHRQAEERIAAERAQRRAENKAARERAAVARAEQQRAADAAREQAQVLEEERRRQRAAAAAAEARSAPKNTEDEEARAAERARKRQAEAERRAARIARAQRRAEEQAEQRREKQEKRRAEREAVQARSRGTDPYIVLGITPDATVEEVTSAYRRLARAHHPDLHRHGTPQERAHHEAQMKRINVAYGILGDARRRPAYDRLRRKS